MNEDLVNLSKDQFFHLVHEWNTSQIPKETKARIHQFGHKVLAGIFLGYALIAGGIWKGDILVDDIEELEKLDASEIYPRRQNAKESLITPQNMEKLYFLWQMVQQHYQEQTTTSKNPL